MDPDLDRGTQPDDDDNDDNNDDNSLILLDLKAFKGIECLK
jgi:hypothetical protein